MEIVALQPAKARLRYFESGDNPSDDSVRNTDGNNSKSEIWVALEELVDPGWYLKTQQFEQALHEHMLARKTNKRGDGA